jgi:hypothetical protein
MDSSIEIYYERQFNALNALKNNATPSELEFYHKIEKKLKDDYESELLPPTEPSKELLLKRRKSLELDIARLRYELEHPELGEHWHQWAQDEIINVQRRFLKNTNQLQAFGLHLSSEPEILPYDANFEHELRVEAIHLQIDELNALRELKIAWLEAKMQTIEQINANPIILSLQKEIDNLSNNKLT